MGEKWEKYFTAQGHFSNSWIAIYEDTRGIYYGYGHTEEEARKDLMDKIDEDPAPDMQE